MDVDPAAGDRLADLGDDRAQLAVRGAIAEADDEGLADVRQGRSRSVGVERGKDDRQGEAHGEPDREDRQGDDQDDPGGQRTGYGQPPRSGRGAGSLAGGTSR